MINIRVFIVILYIIIFIAIFIGCYCITLANLRRNKKLKKKKQKSENNIDKFNKILRKRDIGYFSYEKIEKNLKKKGNPLKLSPAGYIICKALVGIIFFISFSDSLILAFVTGIAGFFLIDFIIYELDKKDMKDIRIQLVDVYDFLSIQTAAGVFIGYALTESYLTVKNKRLKTALAELCAEINLTKDIEGALDKFGESFDSFEIDSFILAIKQSLKTGKIQKALEDLSNAQKDTNIILIQEQTNKIKISKDMVQMLMYFGIIAVIMYSLFLEITHEMNQIF
ncbi:MAG: type II secretion system F family protein [Clostridium sp.]|nr:type II secretion system F family protein [Clostridium sp.]